MFCTTCGKELAEDALFCPNCGAKRFPTPESLTPEPPTPEALTPEPMTPEPVVPEALTPEPAAGQSVSPGAEAAWAPLTAEPTGFRPEEPQPVTAARRSLGRGLLAGLACLLMAALIGGGIWFLLRMNRSDARLYRAASESLSELERYVEDLPNLRTIVENLKNLEPQKALRARLDVNIRQDDWLDGFSDLGKLSLDCSIDRKRDRSLFTGSFSYQNDGNALSIPFGLYVDEEQIQFTSSALLEEGEAVSVPNKGFAAEWNRSYLGQETGLTLSEEEPLPDTGLEAALEALYGEDWTRLRDSFRVVEQKAATRFSGEGTTYAIIWDRDLLQTLREQTGDDAEDLFDYDEADLDRLIRLNSSELNAKMLIMLLSELSNGIHDPLAYVEDGKLRAVAFTAGEDDPADVELRLAGEETPWERITIAVTREENGRTETETGELRISKSEGMLRIDLTENREQEQYGIAMNYRDSDGSIVLENSDGETVEGFSLRPREDGVQLLATDSDSGSDLTLFVSGRIDEIRPFSDEPIELLKLDEWKLKGLFMRIGTKLLQINE